VGRLDVSVQDALGVGIVKGLGQRPEEGDGLHRIERLLRHPLQQGTTGHELDDHVGLAVELAVIEDGQDVAVPELGDGPRLALEAGLRLWAVYEGGQDLDRRPTGQPGVVGLVDDPHPTPTQDAVDDVAPDLGAMGYPALHVPRGIIATEGRGRCRLWLRPPAPGLTSQSPLSPWCRGLSCSACWRRSAARERPSSVTSENSPCSLRRT